MMNRSSSEETFLVSSMMSFNGGLDAAATLKQHHAAASSSWDNWDATTATSHNPAATAAALQNNSFFFNPPALECWPPLLPVSNFLLYSPPSLPPPPPPPEYIPMAGLIKRDIHHFGGGGRIGLNHGHLTYFSPGNELAIDHLLGRRSRTAMYWRGGGHHRQLRRCQVEGCHADLSSAKHYHRRHKVCEFHSKASVAVVAGFRQRFCQQCSRFHALAQFDESKRSCRERLAVHNRRRRKLKVIVPAPAAHAPATAAAADRSSSASVSVSKNTNTNSNSNNSEKSKQLQKTTKISAKSTICTTNTSTKISSNGEGVLHRHPVQENLMRNSNGGPALSLRGVAAEKVGNGSRSNTIYQAQDPFSALDKEKPASPPLPQPQQQQRQQNLQNYYLFSQAGGHSDPAGRLHLGQFEVDYM